MIHISTFFNTQFIADQNSGKFTKSNNCEDVGNFFLKPVRYLCKGYDISEKATSETDPTLKITHSKSSSYKEDGKIKMLLKTTGSIVCVVFGIFLLGGLIKGWGYFTSTTVREKHEVAVLHCTPHEVVQFGSPEERVNLETITEKVEAYTKNNKYLSRKIKTFILYAKPVAELSDSRHYLVADKIILSGAEIKKDGAIDSFLAGGDDFKKDPDLKNPLVYQKKIKSLDEATDKDRQIYILEDIETPPDGSDINV
jgi:hypothetical protein